MAYPCAGDHACTRPHAPAPVACSAPDLRWTQAGYALHWARSQLRHTRPLGLLLRAMGYVLLGLDGEAEVELGAAVKEAGTRAIALVLGAEGPGLREKTKETCDALVKIDAAGGFGSLNVSNAAAVALYAVGIHRG